MVEIEFILNPERTKVQSQLEETFQNAIIKFKQKYTYELGPVNYLYNGKIILNHNMKIKDIIKDLDKRNKKMVILVSKIDQDDKEKDEIIIQSKVIICPDCKEPCRIMTENYKLKLYECINGHMISNIKITDFENTQKINASGIKCDKCKLKNRSNCSEYDFYFCLTCRQNICLICRPSHNSNHNVIRYNQKNYICQLHNESLIKYCKDCKKNICFSCQEHNNHQTVFFFFLIPDINEKKRLLEDIRTWIDEINSNIKEIINEITKQLNGFSEVINKYYEINKNILDNFNVKNRNFQVLENIKEISINNIIFSKLKNIKDNKDLKSKIYDIIDLYGKIAEDDNIRKELDKNPQFENKFTQRKEENNFSKIPFKPEINNNQMSFKEEINANQISSKEILNEINIIYKIEYDEDEIKIFGSDFVKNNKNKCYLEIDNKKVDLCSFLELTEKQKNKEQISSMFQGCNSLLSSPDISKWDTKNVTNMRAIFSGCKSLKSIPDISNWDTGNIENMNSIFCECNSLLSLPDISKWDTKNVTDMGGMFSGCNSLLSLPDISEWNTKKVINMKSMFSQCSSLNSFPDLSEWKIKKDTNTKSMFYGCKTHIIPKRFKN